jgi:hypothetical protein
VLCNSGGSGTSVVEQCPEEDGCAGGACDNECGHAALANSYLGCDFLAVTTSNNQLSTIFDEDFAVVVGNPEGSPVAEVTISRAGSVVASATIQPGDTQAISLPMVQELKVAIQSVLVTGAAYEVKSTVPVVAYQYNPLNFTMGTGTGLSDFSYTNDASLLLPLHALTGNYMASTWPTWGLGSWSYNPLGGGMGDWGSWYPGFVAVAAFIDGTEVLITSSAETAPGTPGALAPGGTANVTLDRGDVAQVFSKMPASGQTAVNFCQNQGWTQSTKGTCPPTLLSECEAFCLIPEGDLTGTVIEASQPVAVFAGHNCTFMPFDQWACDHLEEMMLPLETWGDEVVMTAPVKPDGNGVARAKYRVVARGDGTEITLEPAVIGVTTLDAGRFVEFETDQDFRVSGNRQFFVTQTLLSQQAIGSGAGDPAMGSGIPVFQSRDNYSFLVPATYTANYLNIVAPEGAAVLLDGVAVSGWQAIGSTGYAVARIPVQPGPHRAVCEDGEEFLITSYGYASYTSYLYPGGLNLDEFPVV